MTITVTPNDLERLAIANWKWFYDLLNHVITEMPPTRENFLESHDRDYRDRCARLIQQFKDENPAPNWKDIL